MAITDIIYATTLKPNKLIQNICDTLHDDNTLEINEYQQWEIICQELFQLKYDDQTKIDQSESINDEENRRNKPVPKAISRGTSGIRASGSRSTRSGSSSGTRSGSSSGGSRKPSSNTRYTNTRTGVRISRPTGWQWSRSRLIFLPLATRYFHRSRSSSNRFTTPATNHENYYYCTSNVDPSIEIQCSSTDGDSQCCEDETTHQAFCCGGNIPDYIQQDLNQTTKTIARIFYTLAALTLCMHLIMRRFHS